MADVSDEPRALATLPTELLTLMAEHLDEHSLAHFAAASTVCLAAAHSELRASLVAAVERCVVPGGRISNALAACPYFRLPDDLVVLPEHAFVNCTELTELTLPAALTTIEYGAFRGCTSLTQLVLPTALTTVGFGAFLGCASLTKLTFPAAITTIGARAFSRCTSLTQLTLPGILTPRHHWLLRLRWLHIPQPQTGGSRLWNALLGRVWAVLFDPVASSHEARRLFH